MRVGHLSESLEDYLETIFRLLQKQKVARVRDIARAQDVKTSSVISALKRLAKEQLVEYKAREYVDLTNEGRDLAFRLYQRHTFLKRFLTDLLQVDPETAERDACSLEHSISVTTLDRIASMSEFLSYCGEVEVDLVDRFRDRWLVHLNEAEAEKHCEGKRSAEQAILSLIDLEKGQGGYIARVTGNDKLRKSLIQRGILPGTSVYVLECAKDGVHVRIAGEPLELDKASAACVRVWPHGVLNGMNGANEITSKRTLADLTPGRSFRVMKVTAQGEIRQRMIDMGFIRGAVGRILREALLRDPIEIEINGSLLSLRRVEATGIIVEEIDA